MATEFLFLVPGAFSKPPDQKALNFNLVLSGRNWSKYHGNFGGGIDFSCETFLGVGGLNTITYQDGHYHAIESLGVILGQHLQFAIAITWYRRHDLHVNLLT